MDFKDLVDSYRNAIVNLVVFRAKYGDEMPIEDMALLHKLEKHSAAGNIRSMAIYTAEWIKYTGRSQAQTVKELELPEKAAKLLGSHNRGLRYVPGHGVGYKHDDGTYHYFSV